MDLFSYIRGLSPEAVLSSKYDRTFPFELLTWQTREKEKDRQMETDWWVLEQTELKSHTRVQPKTMLQFFLFFFSQKVLLFSRSHEFGFINLKVCIYNFLNTIKANHFQSGTALLLTLSQLETTNIFCLLHSGLWSMICVSLCVCLCVQYASVLLDAFSWWWEDWFFLPPLVWYTEVKMCQQSDQ